MTMHIYSGHSAVSPPGESTGNKDVPEKIGLAFGFISMSVQALTMLGSHNDTYAPQAELPAKHERAYGYACDLLSRYFQEDLVSQEGKK